MKLNARSLIAIFALCVIGFGSYALVTQFTLPFAIPHGYDGVIATTMEIEHDYPTVHDYNTELAMGVDPYREFPRGGGEYNMQTGLKLSITSPQFVRSEDRSLGPWSVNVTDDEGQKYNETTTQKVSLMTFEMSMNLETYGAGLTKIEYVTLWVELQNNVFSVFTQADDVAISVINVYNMERPYIAQAGKGILFEPEASGADFPLHSMADVEITDFPSWTAERYNLPNLKALSHVKFPLFVLEAQPTTELPLDLGDRVECQVEFMVGIDVLVFGEWVKLKPYREVEWQPPGLTWWEQFTGWISDVWTGFTEFLGSPIGMLYTIVVFVIIAGVIIVVIRMFARRGG